MVVARNDTVKESVTKVESARYIKRVQSARGNIPGLCIEKGEHTTIAAVKQRRSGLDMRYLPKDTQQIAVAQRNSITRYSGQGLVNALGCPDTKYAKDPKHETTGRKTGKGLEFGVGVLLMLFVWWAGAQRGKLGLQGKRSGGCKARPSK